MSEPTPRGDRFWTVALVVMVAISGGLLAYKILRPRPSEQIEEVIAEQRRREVPPFELTAHTGKPFKRDDLLGRPWVATFLFTHCAGPCPRMATEIERLRGELKSTPQVQFVSFSVDPKRDTPEVLSTYASRYGGDDRWILLTGNRDVIFDLSRNRFHAAADDADSSAIDHSTRFFLVDSAGIIRGHYSLEDPQSLAQLAKDARALVPAK